MLQANPETNRFAGKYGVGEVRDFCACLMQAYLYYRMMSRYSFWLFGTIERMKIPPSNCCSRLTKLALSYGIGKSENLCRTFPQMPWDRVLSSSFSQYAMRSLHVKTGLGFLMCNFSFRLLCTWVITFRRHSVIKTLYNSDECQRSSWAEQTRDRIWGLLCPRILTTTSLPRVDLGADSLIHGSNPDWHSTAWTGLLQPWLVFYSLDRSNERDFWLIMLLPLR